MNNSYLNFRKYQVKDVKTAEEFHEKYHKHDRFLGRGEEYAKSVINTSYKDLEKEGFTIITHHDSNTGKTVAFYKDDKIEVVNNANIKITLVGEVEKVTSDFIEKLKEASEPIYWNDSTCTHYIMMFKINNLWLESKYINNELTEIEFYICE